MVEIIYIVLVCLAIYNVCSIVYRIAEYVAREYNRFDNMNKARILAYNAHPFTLFCIHGELLRLGVKTYSIYTTDVRNTRRLNRLAGGFDMQITDCGRDFVLRDCRIIHMTDMDTAFLENRGVFVVRIAFSSYDEIGQRQEEEQSVEA